MPNLNDDFNQVAEKINAKVKEAAKALQEANSLAVQAGLPGLIYGQYVRYEDDSLDEAARESLENDPKWDGESSPLKMKFDLINISDLESEICNAGWSTSSAYC